MHSVYDTLWFGNAHNYRHTATGWSMYVVVCWANDIPSAIVLAVVYHLPIYAVPLQAYKRWPLDCA